MPQVPSNTELTLLQQGKRGILRIIFGRSMLLLLLLALNIVLVLSILFDWLKNVPLLFGSVEVFTAVMLCYVLNTRENPTIKLSWCVIIAILPVFGPVLYFFIKFDLGQRLSRKLVNRSITRSAAYAPTQEDLLGQLKQEEPALHQVAHYLRRYGDHPVYTNTQVTYFPLGEDKFQALLEELEKAEQFIFLEYFLISPGKMWDPIVNLLAQKAREGVEVRLMYDGMNAITNLPYSYPKQLEKLGIQCKLYAPVHPLVSTHYNNRDHRKIAVIDGKVAFTGGINLQDCYINATSPCGHWKDTAVMIRGDAVQGFTRLFLQMWNATERNPVYEPYLALPSDPPTDPGFVIPYGDTPTDREQVGKMVYLNMLNQARDYVYIMTPYLILDGETVTALQFAAQRGVDVRIILPHIPDKLSAFLLAKSHYAELLEAGVRIYEYTPGFVHAKVFLCDDTQAVVGTINLDYRSLYLHFECGAYLYKVTALEDICADFQRTMAQSQEISLADAKRQSLLTRMAGKLLKIAAPLM